MLKIWKVVSAADVDEGEEEQAHAHALQDGALQEGLASSAAAAAASSSDAVMQ